VKIAFLSPALREILEAIEYYEGQATGLGGALDADLRRRRIGLTACDGRNHAAHSAARATGWGSQPTGVDPEGRVAGEGVSSAA
jgi:hypothetical protein